MALAFASRSSSKQPAPVRRAARQTSARVPLRINAEPVRGALASSPTLAAGSTPPAIQAQLKVGEPNDRFEQEADRVADQVMRMASHVATADLPDPRPNSPQMGPIVPQLQVQRLCTECEKKEDKRPSSESPVSSLQTPGKALPPQPAEDEDREDTVVPAKSISAASAAATQSPEPNFRLSNGFSQPLPATIRGFFEPRFGCNFSSVRIHSDGHAAGSAEALNARAYTVGRHIVFGSGQYAPHTEAGRHLLAHELTHVVQQSGNQDVARPTVSQREARVPSSGSAEVRNRTAAAQVQRAADPALAPSGLPCALMTGGGHLTGTDFLFTASSSTLTAAQLALIDALVLGWVGGGSTDDFQVDGYASEEGPQRLNWRLSCDRAEAVKAALVARGVPPWKVATVAHGESTEFSTTALDPNRRAIVSTSPSAGPPPPPPPPPTPPTPVPTTQTVVLPADIRGSATPSSMTQNRIPPRVDTFLPIVLGGTPNPSNPVILSIAGAGADNGTVTINGAPTVSFAVTGVQLVALRGVTQTAPGHAGNLKLVATQGGTKLAESNGVSVSSIPQNMTITFDSLVTGGSRGFVVIHTWESDSGVIADLNQTDVSERVKNDTSGGSLASGSLRTSGYVGTGTTSVTDTHSVPALQSAGFVTRNQTEMFKDLRVGATDIPMTNSGYRIGHFILPIPGSGVLGFFQDFEATTMKFGRATTALGVSSGAGAGSVTKKQRV